MTTLLKTLFGPSSTGMRSPSFNDFSLRVGPDTESELAELYDEDSSYTYANKTSVDHNNDIHPARDNVWQSTFSPQMNVNMKKVGRSMYDTVDDRKHSATVWDNIIKADTIKRVSFGHFDKNKDGLIDAEDLKMELGKDANVDELIKKADKNGDGKIDFEEFCTLLRNS